MNAIHGVLTAAALLLAAMVVPVASSEAQGFGYCFGDPGSGSPCPCGDNDGSVPGSGCDNGVFASGAQLTGSGVADITADTLVLHATHLEPNNAGLYFQADNLVNGGDGVTWGDGLRCAGGSLKRLGVRFSDAGGYSDTSGFSYTLSAKAGNISAGDTKRYQCWYRTTVDPPCGSGLNDFNTTNGYEITWAPGGTYEGMALVPAGDFDMGRHVGSGDADELPVHEVSLDSFYIDVYEVTNEKYAAVLDTAYALGRVTVTSGIVYQVGGAGEALCDTTASTNESRITWNGSSFGAVPGMEQHPMVIVSWYGACFYANQRSLDDALSPCYDEATWDCDFNASGYRLPTEAEWEYAARGGKDNPYSMYPWGDSINGSHANYKNSGDPYDNGTSVVGYYDGNQTPTGVDMANGYGLYDTAGNVWEWCWDWYDPNYYSSSPPSNPTGPISGSCRVFRGGGWYDAPSGLRSAFRSGSSPTFRHSLFGFRVLAVRP